VIISQQRQVRELQAISTDGLHARGVQARDFRALANDEMQARAVHARAARGFSSPGRVSDEHAAPRGLEPEQSLASGAGAQSKDGWAAWVCSTVDTGGGGHTNMRCLQVGGEGEGCRDHEVGACSPGGSPGYGGAGHNVHFASPPASHNARRGETGDEARAAGHTMSSPTPTSLTPTPHPQYSGPRRYSALLDEYMTASRPSPGSRRDTPPAKSKPRVGRGEGVEQRASCSLH
jgi:hypothetical protein